MVKKKKKTKRNANNFYNVFSISYYSIVNADSFCTPPVPVTHVYFGDMDHQLPLLSLSEIISEVSNNLYFHAFSLSLPGRNKQVERTSKGDFCDLDTVF